MITYRFQREVNIYGFLWLEYLEMKSDSKERGAVVVVIVG
jgi:hypothetical protein